MNDFNDLKSPRYHRLHIVLSDCILDFERIGSIISLMNGTSAQIFLKKSALMSIEIESGFLYDIPAPYYLLYYYWILIRVYIYIQVYTSVQKKNTRL